MKASILLMLLAPYSAPADGSIDLDAALAEPGPRWSVDEIAARAVETSPTVQAAAARLAAARARAEEAWSGALPQTMLRASYTRLSDVNNAPIVALGLDPDATRQSIDQLSDPAARGLWSGLIDQLDALAGAQIDVPRNRYALAASVRYPVTPLFFEILPAIRARQRGAEATELEADVTRNDVALEVVELFLRHARARGAAAVSERAVLEAERSLADARAQLESGTGNRPDVLRFEARLAESLGDRAERNADVVATFRALRTLLDLPGSGPLAFAEAITSAPSDPFSNRSVEELTARAEAERDALAAVARWVQSSERAANAQRGGVLPRLLVDGRVDYANPNPLFVPPNEDFEATWALSAVVEWSPDGAWAASRRARRADADLAEIRARLERIRDAVQIEVVTAEARYRAAFQSFDAALRGVRAAEEALRARRRGYEVGTFDATSLIDAELAASRARLAVVDAGVELRIRLARLRRAVGEHLWEASASSGEEL